MSGPLDLVKAATGILGAIAPTIASAIGGPFAGQAVKKLMEVLGLPPGTPDESVMGAVAGATPEQLIRIKEADNSFLIEMKRLEVDFEKMDSATGAADRASARLREQTLRDWTPKVLAFLTTGCYIMIQWHLLTHIIDPSMREMVMRSLGTLDSLIGFVFGYYFGSSAGSQRKTQALASKKE
jgi:hypothetical protein